MATKTYNARIQTKFDTSTNFTNSNPLLLKGEIGVESNTNKMKIGDGVKRWNALPYSTDEIESRLSAIENAINDVNILIVDING